MPVVRAQRLVRGTRRRSPQSFAACLLAATVASFRRDFVSYQPDIFA
jgi:hypothetical protein